MRYVHLPANAVDTALLEDATRRGKLFSPVIQQNSPLGNFADWLKFHGDIEATNAAAAKTR